GRRSDSPRRPRIPAATARRCPPPLGGLGYVTRSARAFLLRPRVLELGAAYLESMNIEQLTKTHLEELARKTADSAALCVLDGVDIVYVARTSVRTLLRLEAHIGSRFPAHATSMGRVLLGGLSAERLQRYFDTATPGRGAPSPPVRSRAHGSGRPGAPPPRPSRTRWLTASSPPQSRCSIIIPGWSRRSTPRAIRDAPPGRAWCVIVSRCCNRRAA